MPGDERTSARRQPTLAIVMPALDEAAAVGAQVRALRAHPAFQALLLARVIVVDNGSRDRTAEVARAAGAEVVREPRQGYGYACLAGVRAAAGTDVVLLMDADGSDDLDGAVRVARLVLVGEADLAMGARVHCRSRRGTLTPQQRAGNAVGALALRLLYGARVSDIAPVRAIGREALLALDPRETGYGWSTEMLAKAARTGLRIVELPVAAHPRAGGKSKVAGTLRGTLGASVHILRTLWRYRAWRPGDGQKRSTDESAPEGLAATASARADCDRQALFVVARLPVAGQTKTRLGRTIGHEAAAALYRAFLCDLSARLTVAAAVDGYDLYWYYAAPRDAVEAEFTACIAPEAEGELDGATTDAGRPGRARFLRQPEGDFAERLRHGFEALAARGYGRIVVLGSDSPQVPMARIAAAFAALETHDIALGPARDGGYYLLGQRGRPADLFTDIQMSTPRVAAETFERAGELGLSVAVLPESFDVDEPEDLDTLAGALANAPSAEADRAPETLAALLAIRGARVAITAVTKSASHVSANEGAAHGAA